MKTKELISTKDGLVLTAMIFTPKVSPKAGVIINSATAVKQSYYEDFARYLMGQGYLVITYDYRGIGASAIENFRDARLTMKAWGEYDLQAVLKWGLMHFEELDWHCVGHSVGGQIIGLADNSQYLKSVYCVSAQSGYWKHWENIKQVRMFAMWHLVVPLLSNLFGKVPGVFLGGESLPGGIAKQWAYWGRHKQYIVDEKGAPIREGFDRIHCDIKFLQIDDDSDFAPPKAVEALRGFYKNANSDIEVLVTKEAGDMRIGHFGFFKRHYRETLWFKLSDWFDIK
ncbi:TPA: alpha/beta hydrolase [Vibrio alginolyticus]